MFSEVGKFDLYFYKAITEHNYYIDLVVVVVFFFTGHRDVCRSKIN